ncbi:MAG: aminotransferase class I/II-fold pyridoxal phosphate-dependent enzyme, partial [Parvularculaceae bacterium]
ISGVMKAHQFIAYTCPPHLQIAVAEGLAFGDDYYEGFVAGMQQKRDLMVGVLAGAGFDVLPCEGTYFATVDIRSVGRADDMAFCREITEKAGVAAVPVSAFYYGDDQDAPKSYARFCFCKKRDVIEAAGERLSRYFA